MKNYGLLDESLMENYALWCRVRSPMAQSSYNFIQFDLASQWTALFLPNISYNFTTVIQTRCVSGCCLNENMVIMLNMLFSKLNDIDSHVALMINF